MDAIGRLSDLVFDCADPDRLAEFWSQVFGMRVLRTDADSVTLAGTRPPHRISFQRCAGYVAPAWPDDQGSQQLHLDVVVGDLAEAVRRTTALGARPLTDTLDEDQAAWRIMADPEGHPFCLVTTRWPVTGSSVRPW
jgi:catechol 2,3-dioxygenase-like lactoylglutathione lyase family enzyme